MSYLVLARKWRPQRFEDIVGQPHVTRVLRNAIGAGRIAHAYLFTGVRGVGKTTAARVLAKALNCDSGPTADPCNECGQCTEIASGSAIDVYEIDGASNRGIDEVRQIIENVRYQPAKSRFKIYIIDEVHQVTKDAFNALLKTLEEPPPFVKFILATTEPHRLPETILSRCQRFDFRRISVREIIQRLQEIAETEGLRITEGALLLIAREAEGSMRDAQSLLEQLLSYAVPAAGGENSKVAIDELLLQDILGVAERKVLYDLSHAVIQGDAARCLGLVGELVTQARDMTRLSRELVEHFRNLLVVRLSGEQREEEKDRQRGSALFDRLLDLPDQEIAELKRQAAELSADTLMDYFRFMAEGDEQVARSAYPRFALETALVRLATLPKTVPVAEIVERLERMEQRLSRDAAAPLPQSRERRAGGEVREAGAVPGAAASGGSSQEEVWKKFVAFVMKEKKLLGSHLEQVRPLEMPPGALKIGVGERYHLTYFQDPENLASLKDLARRFFAQEVAVGITSVGTRNPEFKNNAQPSADSPRPYGDRGGDIVTQALKIFGGSVKEVKGENG